MQPAYDYIQTDWWQQDAKLQPLLGLARTVLTLSAGHHVVGIGQSPYYPLFAANLISVQQKGEPLALTHLQMSDCMMTRATLRAMMSPSVRQNFELNVYADEHPDAIEAMTAKVGAMCDDIRATGKKPLFFDTLFAGRSFASIGYMLQVYDEQNGTDHFNSAKHVAFSNMYNEDPSESFMLGIPHGEDGYRYMTVLNLFTNGDLYMALGRPTDDAGVEYNERVVPYCPIHEWGAEKPLHLDAPTPVKIQNAIKIAVAARL